MNNALAGTGYTPAPTREIAVSNRVTHAMQMQIVSKPVKTIVDEQAKGLECGSHLRTTPTELL
jgi:hypothetical protein